MKHHMSSDWKNTPVLLDRNLKYLNNWQFDRNSHNLDSFICQAAGKKTGVSHATAKHWNSTTRFKIGNTGIKRLIHQVRRLRVGRTSSIATNHCHMAKSHSNMIHMDIWLYSWDKLIPDIKSITNICQITLSMLQPIIITAVYIQCVVIQNTDMDLTAMWAIPVIRMVS